jgi:hypothetical protein
VRGWADLAINGTFWVGADAVVAAFGVKAERASLEAIARPLSAADE